MNERDYKRLLALSEMWLEEVRSETKEESRAALIDLGILDEDGNLTKEYEGLCINVQQAS